MNQAPSRQCPALLISAPASHQGKTTLCAGLARHHRDQGRKVRAFKVGPDFLDPYILRQASGATVYSLDLWMNGIDDCRARLYQAAQDADLILVEGSMGLFDGSPSSADLALQFGLPVMAVIDASGMGQTFGAIAQGLAQYRPELAFYGVLANQVASTRHEDMLRAGLPAGLRCLGAIARQNLMSLPERHLGLVPAEEVSDLEQRLDLAAVQLGQTDLRELPPPITFSAPTLEAPQSHLKGRRIAIACDAAFSFIYPANLQLLRQLGAELSFFSPLADQPVPPCDAVYLPGGYPELYLGTLSASHESAASLRQHVSSGKTLYAECGGMLYLLDSLTDQQGRRAEMLGLLPGHATVHNRLSALGLQFLDLAGEVLRGHTFHYSTLDTPLAPFTHAQRAASSAQGEAVYRHNSIQASYMHAYFPSNPSATAKLFLS